MVVIMMIKCGSLLYVYKMNNNIKMLPYCFVSLFAARHHQSLKHKNLAFCNSYIKRFEKQGFSNLKDDETCTINVDVENHYV